MKKNLIVTMIGYLGSKSINLKHVLLGIFLFLIVSGIDWTAFFDNASSDALTTGKIKYLLLAASVCSFYLLKKYLGVWAALFISMVFSSFIIRGLPLYSFETIICIIGGLLFAIFYTSHNSHRRLAYALSYLGLFEATIGLLQWRGIYPLFSYSDLIYQNLPNGTIGQHTQLGAFLCICIAASLWEGYFFRALVMMACLFATGSSMAIGAFGVIFLFFVWHKYYLWAAIDVFIIGASALILMYCFNIAPNFFVPTGRFEIWNMGIKAWMENPWFGGGSGYWTNFWQPQNFPIVAKSGIPSHVHSEPLEALVEYGVVGGSLILLGFLNFIKNIKPTWYHASVFAIAINSLANWPLHIVPCAVLFLLCWIYSNQNKESHAPTNYTFSNRTIH